MIDNTYEINKEVSSRSKAYQPSSLIVAFFNLDELLVGQGGRLAKFINNLAKI